MKDYEMATFIWSPYLKGSNWERIERVSSTIALYASFALLKQLGKN